MRYRRILTATIVAVAMTIPTAVLTAQAGDRHGKDQDEHGQAAATERMPMPTLCKAKTLMGAAVRDPWGEELGTIEDLVLDADRQRVLHAIVASGGVLGMGEDEHTVAWDQFEFRPASMQNEQPEIVLPMSRAQLEESARTRYGEGEQRGQELDRPRLSNLMGREIHDHQDENLGEVEDVAIDLDGGRLAFAIMEVREGFIDLDTDHVAIAWDEVQTGGENVRADKDRSQLREMGFEGDLTQLEHRIQDRATRYGAQAGSMTTVEGQITSMTTTTWNGEQHLRLEVMTEDGRRLNIDGGEVADSERLNLQKGDRVTIEAAQVRDQRANIDLMAHAITADGQTCQVNRGAGVMKEGMKEKMKGKMHQKQQKGDGGY